MTEPRHRVTLSFTSDDVTIDLSVETERAVPMEEQIRLTTQLLRDLTDKSKGGIGVISVATRHKEPDGD